MEKLLYDTILSIGIGLGIGSLFVIIFFICRLICNKIDTKKKNSVLGPVYSVIIRNNNNKIPDRLYVCRGKGENKVCVISHSL